MSPEIKQQAARRAEALAARAVRAAALLRVGRIEAVAGDQYRGYSADGQREYAVRAGYCSCPDFAWRGEVPCKHQIAVQLLSRSLRPIA